MTRYFIPTTPTRAGKRVRVDSGDLELRQKEVKPDGWVRARRRTGIEALRGRMTAMDRYTRMSIHLFATFSSQSSDLSSYTIPIHPNPLAHPFHAHRSALLYSPTIPASAYWPTTRLLTCTSMSI